MTFVRARMRLALIATALCVPPVSTGQTVAATPSSSSLTPPQQPSPAVPDTAKRLDGRLFFSAQQRQRMDEARKRGVVSGDDGQLVETPPSVLNGFVKRSDGNTAVWVDGVSRWNAKGGRADSLSPSDVGGPAAYLKTIRGEIGAVSPTHHVRIKKPVMSRVKKITKRRQTR